MYFIKCQDHYIGKDNNNRPTKVANIKLAIKFNSITKANNYKRTLPKIYTDPIIEESCETVRVEDRIENMDMSIIEGISDAINEFNLSLQKLKRAKEEVELSMSYYDTKKSEFEHLFEFSKLPANVRSIMDKAYDECLRERRENKRKYAKLCSINAALKRSGINTRIDNKVMGGDKFIPTILKNEFEVCKRWLI